MFSIYHLSFLYNYTPAPLALLIPSVTNKGANFLGVIIQCIHLLLICPQVNQLTHQYQDLFVYADSKKYQPKLYRLQRISIVYTGSQKCMKPLVITNFINWGLVQTPILEYTFVAINSGGTRGFKRLAERLIHSQKSSLIFTWVLGLILFIDDYINNLGIGPTIRDITDKHKVPRESLGFVICCMGTPICAIVPLTAFGSLCVWSDAEFGCCGRGCKSPNGICEAYSIHVLSDPYRYHGVITRFREYAQDLDEFHNRLPGSGLLGGDAFNRSDFPATGLTVRY